MQEKHLYEYAVIRVVPVVEREEFLNVGIILFCKKAKYIHVLSQVDEKKLVLFCKDIDVTDIQKNLLAFKNIAEGVKSCGPIAQMELPERFRWLTAIKSSSIQTSRPHPGLTENLEETCKRLFEELVL